MNARSPESFTAEELRDPSVPAQTLADVAAVRPDLWQEVLAHPNCYQGLTEWITAQLPAPRTEPAAPARNEPEVAQPVTPEAASAEPTPEPVARQQYEQAEPQAYEPTPGEPHYQPQTPEAPSHQQAPYQEQPLPQQPYTQPQQVQQPYEPAPQQAYGAQGYAQPSQPTGPSYAQQAQQFYEEHVAPTAAGAAQQLQEKINLPAGAAGARAWPTLALGGLSVLLLFTCFMPMLTVEIFGVRAGFGFFSGYGPSGGVVLVLVSLLAIAGVVTYLVTAAQWARLAASITGIVAGVVGLILFIVLAINAASEMGSGEFGMGLSFGSGSFIMLFVSIATAAAGVLLLVLGKTTRQ